VASSIRKKLAITLPTSGGRSVVIVRSQTQTMELSFLIVSHRATEFVVLYGILNLTAIRTGLRMSNALREIS
jgi:hypothetical protein